MVSSGSGQQPTRPSQGVLFLLQRSGLMTSSQYVKLSSLWTRFWTTNSSNSALQITSAGFQFLLHSPHDQLWDLLLQYLLLAEVRLDCHNALCFKLRLYLKLSSGTPNGFGRGFGVHIHAFYHGIGQGDVFSKIYLMDVRPTDSQNFRNTPLRTWAAPKKPCSKTCAITVSFGSEEYVHGLLPPCQRFNPFFKANITAFQPHPSCDHLDFFFSTASHFHWH